MVYFPVSQLLPVKVEILLNGTWTDITTYVQTRDEANPITITGGAQDEDSSPQPSVCTLTLNNTDGRFSPNYLSGAYSPYLKRNIQLRVSIVAVNSVTNNTYSGYRFWGEVPDWPPQSDITGSDVFVTIQATGPFRRLRTAGSKGSVLTRYYASLTGANAPIAYWPLEDDPYTNSAGTAITGGLSMTIQNNAVGQGPFWAAFSSFDGSLPIPLMNGCKFTGLTNNTTATTTNVIRGVLWVPSKGGNDMAAYVQINTNSTVASVIWLYYRKGGKLQMRIMNNSNHNVVDTGQIAFGVDGVPIMWSIELVQSGGNINWALRTITPGATSLLGSTTGSVAGTVSYVTQVILNNSKTIYLAAMAHVSVQNALIPLTTVSGHLNGHTNEISVDRLIRIANEQAMGAEIRYAEGSDHWAFASTVQGWTGTNATIAQSGVVGPWTDGSVTGLVITASGGAGLWGATSPTGTSGQPVIAGDIVTANADLYSPTTVLNQARISILWYNAAGTFLSQSNGPARALPAGGGQFNLFQVKGTAPATAAFFAIQAADNETDTTGTVMWVGNVRVAPQMGPQTAKEIHEIAKEIERLDRGILEEAKDLWGLGYATRISLINQSPSLTLNYATAQISGILQPVQDNFLTENHVIVHRKKGSKVEVVLNSGVMSIQEPPSGVGRKKRHHRVIANDDAQLAALAAHLLTIGTDSNERYPVVSVDMRRPAVANLFSAIGGLLVGQYIQITNLPFWYPSSTAKQLMIGYTETLTQYTWTIDWNCRPENPFEIIATALRRW